MKNKVIIFLRTSKQRLRGRARIIRQKHRTNSFVAGPASSQIARPSSSTAAGGPSQIFQSEMDEMEAQLEEMSRKSHMLGAVTPRSHGVLKTFSLRSWFKISRISERTVSSKACSLPDQIFTHSFKILRSHGVASPEGPTWPRAQHEQWAVLKEMDSNCCLMVSKSLKYFRRVLTQGYEPARLMGAIGM